MAAVHIRPEVEIRESAEAAFVEHRRRVLGVLPRAEIEHVGSTAVRGALTKRDLDLLVRVEAADVDAAIAGLRGLYAVDQPENWTSTFTSFRDPRSVGPPVVAAGSADDALFGPFRDALVGDPALLAEYNALKLQNDGEDYERYTGVKAEFVDPVLARLHRRLP
jgi:GrpB-like predicted nucleotidyltransferase (UPF0157 family)